MIKLNLPRISKTNFIFFLQPIVERITGKSCATCKYRIEKGGCDSPNRQKCLDNIFPKGWERR